MKVVAILVFIPIVITRCLFDGALGAISAFKAEFDALRDYITK